MSKPDKLDTILQKVVKIEAEMATKSDLRHVEGKIDHLQTSMDKLTNKADALEIEKAANTTAHERFERRDEVFASKLGVKLDRVDSAL